MSSVIPSYVAPVVLAVDVALAYWLIRLVSRAADTVELNQDTRRRIRLGTGIVIGGWLLLALLLAGSSPATDAAGNGRVPITFPLFAGGSLVLALGLLALSPTWRRVVDAIPAESLISVQIFRLIGGIFLTLYAIGSLPRYFAYPAGWGDIAVGFAAPVVALAVRNRVRAARSLALGWNLFGLLDLLTAVGLGTGYLLAVAGTSGPISTVPAMTFFPLVLIPTFVVPVAIILHIYSIRRTVNGAVAGRRDSGSAVRAATRVA
jgi:hypothetical protein